MAAPPTAFLHWESYLQWREEYECITRGHVEYGPHNVIAWLQWRNVRMSCVTDLELSVQTEGPGWLLYPLPSLLSIILSSINSSIITIIFNYRDQYIESQDGCCEGEGWHADAQIEAHALCAKREHIVLSPCPCLSLTVILVPSPVYACLPLPLSLTIHPIYHLSHHRDTLFLRRVEQLLLCRCIFWQRWSITEQYGGLDRMLDDPELLKATKVDILQLRVLLWEA